MQIKIYRKKIQGITVWMRRSMLMLSVLVASFKSATASVSNYSFTSSSGNYVAITGTTLFSGTWDDNTSSLLTIPFTFTYNNVAYTTVGVNTNGFITMGAVPASVYCGLQSSAPNSIAAYGTDLVGSSTSTIQYATRGSSPNRQFVVQWADVDHWNNANADHWYFQIILNETSNTVQVVWGASTDAVTMVANTCADVATESGDVGLLGASTADFNIRKVTNGTNTWATSTAGINLSDVCNMSSSNIPANGLTYTWTPAVPVAMSFISSTTVFLNNGQSVSRSTQGNPVIRSTCQVSLLPLQDALMRPLILSMRRFITQGLPIYSLPLLSLVQLSQVLTVHTLLMALPLYRRAPTISGLLMTLLPGQASGIFFQDAATN
jgi:hypothetical protein